MKKKFISLMLALVVVLGLCAGITSISVIAKADAEISVKELFNATNTYNLNGNISKIEQWAEYHDQMGYEKPQYSFEYNLSTKNASTTTTAPCVTVFTHGYNSQASDWTNNAEYLEKGDTIDKFIFKYSPFSMVSQVASKVFKGDALIIRGQLTEGIETDTGKDFNIEP